MKGQMCIPVAVLVSVALMGFMKVRQPEHEKEDKRFRFGDIKVRVTRDVLRDYESERAEKRNRVDTMLKAKTGLEEQVSQIQSRADMAKAETERCEQGKKTTRDEMGSVETEYSNLQAGNEKEKTNWTTEIQTLEKQLAARSAVCDFLKEDAQAVRSELCKGPNEEAPKQEEAKAETTKAEEPKAEAPKEEEAKAEAPKAEEPKAEAPKEEEAKAEAPKVEAPKEEAAAEVPKKR